MKISAHLDDPDIYAVTIGNMTILNLDYKTPQEPSSQPRPQQP